MDGSLTRVDGGYEVRFVRSLTHPVDVVWSALTDPDERSRWFFGGILELAVGGRVLLDDSDDGITGTVTAIEPPRLLEFTWSSLDAPTSTARFELGERGEDGCLLTFVHAVDHTARPENLLPGWHCVFDFLPIHLDGGSVTDVPDRFAALKRHYVATVLRDGEDQSSGDVTR